MSWAYRVHRYFFLFSTRRTYPGCWIISQCIFIFNHRSLLHGCVLFFHNSPSESSEHVVIHYEELLIRIMNLKYWRFFFCWKDSLIISYEFTQSTNKQNKKPTNFQWFHRLKEFIRLLLCSVLISISVECHLWLLLLWVFSVEYNDKQGLYRCFDV